METVAAYFQVFLTPILLIVVLVHQSLRIKHLKEQIGSQRELLEPLKLYGELYNPEKIDHRIKMYEKIIEVYGVTS